MNLDFAVFKHFERIALVPYECQKSLLAVEGAICRAQSEIIVQQLGSTLQNTVGSVGGLVNRLLMGTVNGVQRLIDTSTGNIVEKAVSAAGQNAAEKVVGSVTQLPVISQTTDAAGNIVKRARDAATNAIVSYTLSKAGKFLGASIVQAATK